MRTFQYNGETLSLVLATFASGNLAVTVRDQFETPYATLSVNFPESKDLPEDHFYLKDWSENKKLAQAVIDAGLIEAANPFIAAPIRSGFVVAHAYKLTTASRPCRSCGAPATCLFTSKYATEVPECDRCGKNLHDGVMGSTLRRL